jgi:hypothetical protein
VHFASATNDQSEERFLPGNTFLKEEQLYSIVIEFLFVAKQNKTVFGC